MFDGESLVEWTWSVIKFLFAVRGPDGIRLGIGWILVIVLGILLIFRSSIVGGFKAVKRWFTEHFPTW